MKFRINYNLNFKDYCFEVEADTIKEIRKKAFEELEKRGVDLNKNSCWSEQIK